MDDYEKNYQVFDIETSSIKKNKKEQHKDDIALHGLISKKKNTPVKLALSIEPIDKNFPWDLSNTSVIVCHNIKFDLGIIWENDSLNKYLDRDGGVWCTQVAEYLLCAQVFKTRDLSLKKIETRRYGASQKIDVITKCFKREQGTDKILAHPRIPVIKRLFKEYCIADGEITERLYLQQYKEAKSRGMLDIIKAYSMYALAQIEEEHNGLPFDEDTARAECAQLYLDTLPILDNLAPIAAKYWDSRLPQFSLGSPKQFSVMLYGGTLKGKVREDTGTVYGPKAAKVGQRKLRNKVIDVDIKGFKKKPNKSSEGKVKGIYTVTEGVLEEFSKSDNKDLSTFCTEIVKYRKLKKLIGTYYESSIDKLRDGIIYHKYNNTHVATGRLSGKNPNAQNQPSNVKHLFKSRYGDMGSIVEFDFSQLEVLIQAWLANCPKMLNDIKAGTDFHCKRLAYAEDRDYYDVVELCATDPKWKKKRSVIGKPISFQKAYGAAPKSIAAGSGLPLEVVERVFQKEDEEYPEIKNFYDNVKDDIIRSSRRTSELLKIKDKQTGDTYSLPGEFRNVGFHQTITGKTYSFKDLAVSGKFGLFKYWPQPDIYNYPIQGTAADIQAVTHIEVFKFMRKHRDKGLMWNEVHDSKIFDIKNEHLDWIIPRLYTIIKDVQGAMLKHLGIKFDAPLGVDVEYGPTWADMKEYKL